MRTIKETFRDGSQTANSKEKPYAVAVFAASNLMNDPGFAEDAAYVGKALAERGHHFIYGGGSNGLMGISSKAALDAGGSITGYMMSCFNQEGPYYPQKDFEQLCMTIAERKQKMLLHADAYIALGGGFGTFDEIIEAGTEQYMGAYTDPPSPRKPIILINRGGIYDPLMDQLDKFIELGSARPEVKDLFILVKDGREAIAVLERERAKEPEHCVAIDDLGHHAELKRFVA